MNMDALKIKTKRFQALLWNFLYVDKFSLVRTHWMSLHSAEHRKSPWFYKPHSAFLYKNLVTLRMNE